MSYANSIQRKLKKKKELKESLNMETRAMNRMGK